MSFRKYGGINYSARNNIIKNNYTNTNNLIVTDKVNLQNSSTTSGPTGPQGLPGVPGLTGPQGTNNSGNLTNYWGQTGSNIYYTNGNVGIGTNNPQAVLDINNSNNNNLSLNVNGLSQFNGNLLPSQPNIFNLGSSSMPWNSLYVSSNTINLGNELKGFASISYEYDDITNTDVFVLVKIDGTKIILGETIDRTIIKDIINDINNNNIDLFKTKVGTIDANKNITGLTGINQLLFDVNSGFNITPGPTGSSSIVGMNGAFKYLNIDGSNGITASGLDTINFVSGTGIHIRANNVNNTITIDSLSQGAQGPTGPASYADQWIKQNLTEPPPKITYKYSMSNSTSIYSCWDYPQQTKLSFLNVLVPHLNSLSCLYTGINNNNNNNTTINGTIINNNSDDNYIKNNSESNIGQIITGIVLIKNSPCYIDNITVESGKFYDIYFPQDNNYNYIDKNITRKALVYYDPCFNEINIDNDNNMFNIYYSNYTGNNDTNIPFKIFNLSDVPSIITQISTTDTNSSITINFTQPLYGDKTNIYDKVKLDKYKIIYTSISNTVRYGSFTSNESILYDDYDNTTANNNTIEINGLDPDTTYNIKLSSKNIYNENYSTNAENNSLTLNIQPRLTTIGNISFSNIAPTSSTEPTTLYSAIRVKDGIYVNNLIISNNEYIDSDLISFSINEEYNRGILNNNNNSVLTTIKTSIETGTTVIDGPSIDFKGFPITSYSSASNNSGITIIPNTPKDSYENDTSKSRYYLESQVAIRLNTSQIIIPYEEKYILKVIRQGHTTNQSTFEYYCDSYPNINPSIGNITINDITTYSSSEDYSVVSGVYVLNNNTFILNVTVNNVAGIGNFFTNQQLITYYSQNPDQYNYETTLSNVISGYTSGNLSINSPITFRNSNIYFKSNIYSEKIALTVTARNILGTSVTKDCDVFNAIIDPESINLVNRILQKNINYAKINVNTPTTGLRVWSGVAIDEYYLPPLLYNNTTPYVTIIYDNIWDISKTDNNGIDATQELQIVNGKFVTKSSNNGYKNYNGYRYTNSNKANLQKCDYSGISSQGYRFATFAYSFSQVPDNQYLFSRIKVLINNINLNSLILKNNNILYTLNNERRILLYYRLEDNIKNKIGIDSSLTTNWIDGNSYINPPLTTYNYNTPDHYPLCGIAGQTQIIDNLVIFHLQLPSGLTLETYSRYTLYLRIGLPQEEDVQFESISVLLEQ